MKQFFLATGSEEILERLESNEVWPLMEKEETCPHAMLHLARYIHLIVWIWFTIALVKNAVLTFLN